jgi:hypothetical protein
MQLLNMPKKTKTYIVPIVIHCRFGAEAEVQAASKREAIKLAQAGEGLPEQYDWNRFEESSIELGDWQPVQEAE